MSPRPARDVHQKQAILRKRPSRPSLRCDLYMMPRRATSEGRRSEFRLYLAVSCIQQPKGRTLVRRVATTLVTREVVLDFLDEETDSD